MRRPLMVLLAAAFGTTVLIGLKTPLMSPTQVVADSPLGPDRSPTPDTSTVPAIRPSATAKPTTTGSPKATPGPGTTPKPAAPKTTAAAPTARTLVGTAHPAVWEGKNYGNMQVKIVVTGSHIDKVLTIQQSNRPKTVASTLGSRAVSRQSANVGNVSGATASSIAYKKSLQSAIDKI